MSAEMIEWSNLRRDRGEGAGDAGGEMLRRRTHESPHAPDRSTAAARRHSGGNIPAHQLPSKPPFRGAPSNSESGSDYNGSDRSGLDCRAGGGLPRDSGGLKPLPENTSFRGSTHFNLHMDDYRQEYLHAMGVEELRAELTLSGIPVDGVYEKRELIAMCADLGAGRYAGRPPAGIAAQPPTRGGPSGRHAPVDDQQSRKSYPPGNGDLHRPKGRNADHIGRPRRRATVETDAGHAGPLRRPLRRQTIERANGHSSANPQDDSPQQHEGRGRNPPEEEMAVLNAPLGAHLAGDHPPHRKRGPLSQQRHHLDEGAQAHPGRRASPGSPLRGHPGGQPRIPLSQSDVIARRTPPGPGPKHSSFSFGEKAPRSNPGKTTVGVGFVADPRVPTGAADLQLTGRSLSSKSLGSNLGGQNNEGCAEMRGSMFDQSLITAQTAQTLKSNDSKENWFSPYKWSKKYIGVAAALILLVVVALTLTSVFVLRDEDGRASEEASVQASDSGLASPRPTAHPTPIEPPPHDIEGRCTPANLPGSLPACRAACLPSACCYSTYNGRSCIDHNNPKTIDACNQYSPYCDIVYDVWPGAYLGSLRNPPEGIEVLCKSYGAKEKVDDVKKDYTEVEKSTETAGNTETERPGDSFEIKRHRDHASVSGDLRGMRQNKPSISEQRPQDDGRGPRRNLWDGPKPDKTCQLLCRAARCCHAPPHVAGTYLSDSGVVFDPTSGEHVVTSCIGKGTGQNKELCRKFEKFCDAPSSHANSTPSDENTGGIESEDGAADSMLRPWTDSPTAAAVDLTAAPHASIDLSPAPSSIPTHVFVNSHPATASPYPTTSLSPTASPASWSTTSRYPTTSIPQSLSVVPPALTFEIAAACSGTKNVAAISDGVVSARSSCLSACQSGLCCFSDALGYSTWMQPCYEGQEMRCLEYSSCLVLVNDVEPYNGAVVADNNTISKKNHTTDYISHTIEVPPAPAQNLHLLCSRDSILTLPGLLGCASACKLGSCCEAQQDSELSCYDRHPETCALFHPCLNMVPQDEEAAAAEEDFVLPPAASSDLAFTCSYESLALSASGEVVCSSLCDSGLCCSNNTCLEGWNVSQAVIDSLEDICETYSPCYNTNLLYPPPSDLAELCSPVKQDDGRCASICDAISCCFSGSTSFSNPADVSSSSSCYEYFKETCDGYAPFCAPRPPTSVPTIAPAITLPSPPSDLEAICAFSPDLCNKACKIAFCCFESSVELSCYANNIERCDNYLPCNKYLSV